MVNKHHTLGVYFTYSRINCMNAYARVPVWNTRYFSQEFLAKFLCIKLEVWFYALKSWRIYTIQPAQLHEADEYLNWLDQLASQSDIGCYITYLQFIYTLLTHLVCCWSKKEVASMGVDNSFRFRCTPRSVQYVQHVFTVHWLRRAVSGLSIKSLYKTIWKTNGWVTIYYSFTVSTVISFSRKNILLFNMVLVITCSMGMSLPYIGTVAPVLWATNTCFTQSHPSTASSTIAFSGIILPSRTASLAVITVFAWAENKVKNISLPSHNIENGGGGRGTGPGF